jgi:hypothetical protein
MFDYKSTDASPNVWNVIINGFVESEQPLDYMYVFTNLIMN